MAFPQRFMDRQVVFGALTGSYNYNLNTEGSDKDYHMFVCPSYLDLYKGDRVSKQYIGEDLDLMVYDIRKFSELLWKSNPSFIELLFTKDLVRMDSIYGSTEITGRVNSDLDRLFGMRNDLARMNLPYLWDGCVGIFRHKMNNYLDGTAGTQDLVRAYGYDTKQAMHAIRSLMVLERYAATGFTDYGKAIWMEGEDRDYLLSIKNGRYSAERMAAVMEKKLESVQPLKDLYKAENSDKETKEIMDGIVESISTELVYAELKSTFRKRSGHYQTL